MLLRNRCMLALAVVGLVGTVGCSAPTAAPEAKAAKVSSGVVFNTRASKETQAKLGITRWHAIIEQKSGSVVIDGADAKGNVKFATVMRRGFDQKSIWMESYGKKGLVAFDMKTGVVQSNTLPGIDWAKY